MECIICMEAIQGDKNISTTVCGHSFHHQCLYNWHRRHTNCPLCRKEFGEDQVEDQVDSYVNDYIERMIRYPRLNIQFITATAIEPIRQELLGTIEERDVQLVMRQVPGDISYELAETSLRQFHGDLVDTILYLTEHKGMPIPEFRERERPPLSEPYQQRTIRNRLVSSSREEADMGYESA